MMMIDYANFVNEYDEKGYIGPIPILNELEAKQTWIDYQQLIRELNSENNQRRYENNHNHNIVDETNVNSKGNDQEISYTTNDNNCLSTSGTIDTSVSNPLIGSSYRFKTHLFVPFVNRIVHHPKLIQLVRSLLCNSNHIGLWSCDFNIKLPNSVQYFPPHQDGTYTGLIPSTHCCTVWMAISEQVNMKNGCLQFYESSHKLGQLRHDESNDDPNNMLSRGQRILTKKNDRNEDYNIVSIPLLRGEVTVHHFLTIHQSGHNHTNEQRVGLALRYIDCTKVRSINSVVRHSITQVYPSIYNNSDNNNTDNTINNDNNRNDDDDDDIGFDFEVNLPLLYNPSNDDIQRGKIIHSDAMKREVANYFADSTIFTKYR